MEALTPFLPLVIIAVIIWVIIRWRKSVNYLKRGGESDLRKQGIIPVKPTGKSKVTREWKPMSLYKERVVGVTRKNDDGGSRQKFISKLHEGDAIDLVRDPDNEYDPNAIEVYTGYNQIGFISKDRAPELAPQMDKGYKVEAWVDRILGGGSGQSYGVVIAIQRHKPNM